MPALAKGDLDLRYHALAGLMHRPIVKNCCPVWLALLAGQRLASDTDTSEGLFWPLHQGTAVYVPEKEALVWKIKAFPGGREFLLRAKFSLPSVAAEEEPRGPHAAHTRRVRDPLLHRLRHPGLASSCFSPH